MSLTKHDNLYDLEKRGIEGGRRNINDNIDITEKYNECFKSETEMEEIYNWINSYSPNYDLASHNCQHFGLDFRDKFRLKSAIEKTLKPLLTTFNFVKSINAKNCIVM